MTSKDDLKNDFLINLSVLEREFLSEHCVNFDNCMPSNYETIKAKLNNVTMTNFLRDTKDMKYICGLDCVINTKLWKEKKISFEDIEPSSTTILNPLYFGGRAYHELDDYIFSNAILEVFEEDSELQLGLGLRTKSLIKNGEVIAEYTGLQTYITTAEDDQPGYFTGTDDPLGVEGELYGNCCRFINHACKDSNLENCLSFSVWVNGYQRIFIEAKRDLEPNTKLRSNYGDKYWYHSLICRCSKACVNKIKETLCDDTKTSTAQRSYFSHGKGRGKVVDKNKEDRISERTRSKRRGRPVIPVAPFVVFEKRSSLDHILFKKDPKWTAENEKINTTADADDEDDWFKFILSSEVKNSNIFNEQVTNNKLTLKAQSIHDKGKCSSRFKLHVNYSVTKFFAKNIFNIIEDARKEGNQGYKTFFETGLLSLEQFGQLFILGLYYSASAKDFEKDMERTLEFYTLLKVTKVPLRISSPSPHPTSTSLLLLDEIFTKFILDLKRAIGSRDKWFRTIAKDLFLKRDHWTPYFSKSGTSSTTTTNNDNDFLIEDPTEDRLSKKNRSCQK